MLFLVLFLYLFINFVTISNTQKVLNKYFWMNVGVLCADVYFRQSSMSAKHNGSKTELIIYFHPLLEVEYWYLKLVSLNCQISLWICQFYFSYFQSVIRYYKPWFLFRVLKSWFWQFLPVFSVLSWKESLQRSLFHHFFVGVNRR